MRSPGREADLAAGFLASEGIVEHAADLSGVEPCVDPGTGLPEANVWNVTLAEGAAFDPRMRRAGVVGSSCGLCGVQTLAELEKRVPALVPAPERLPADFLVRGFARMREEQAVFQETAGVHAAALLGLDGGWIDLAEDIGRHNAVDKILGARVRAGDYPVDRPLALLVSGRISFEIAQKAALAGVVLVAGVSAPTSLAVDAAEDFGQTLYGMVRNGSANRYAGRIRIGG